MLAKLIFEYWDSENREQFYYEEIICIEDRAYEKAIRWAVAVAGRSYSIHAENREVDIAICEHRPLTFSEFGTLAGAWNYILVARTVNYADIENVDYAVSDMTERFTDMLRPAPIDYGTTSRTFEPIGE